MEQKNLQNKEFQTTFIPVYGAVWEFRFYEFRGLMYYDIRQDGEPVISGQRVLAWQWLIPEYMGSGTGNLRFEVYDSDMNDYVWYEGFNTKFRLMMYTDEEKKEMEEKGLRTLPD